MPGLKPGIFIWVIATPLGRPHRKNIPVSVGKDSVMAGLVPAIHVCSCVLDRKTWMAGINPAMTI